jgi:hypothetical protein
MIEKRRGNREQKNEKDGSLTRCAHLTMVGRKSASPIDFHPFRVWIRPPFPHSLRGDVCDVAHDNNHSVLFGRSRQLETAGLSMLQVKAAFFKVGGRSETRDRGEITRKTLSSTQAVLPRYVRPSPRSWTVNSCDTESNRESHFFNWVVLQCLYLHSSSPLQIHNVKRPFLLQLCGDKQ